jgi:multimeric flavodoxin WrbA
MSAPKKPAAVRRGMPDVSLSRPEFERRYRQAFFDPAFESHGEKISGLIEIAWDAYRDSRKSPRTVKAGEGYADPDHDLSVEWLAASKAIVEAQGRQIDSSAANRILLINGSMRSDQTCPGEISKSWRLLQIAREAIAAETGFEIEVLDLSRLASEYGRTIHPCKSCVSTAMPLCHWPCSCYPNHSLGQVKDWMNDIYPMWVAAHGIMIVTPVNWYQAPSGLKAMIDRLVCADGGNPDPTSTSGKDPEKAKELELAGWPYPRHLAGRVFSVVVHGDTAGVENLHRILSDWLTDMGLIPAGHLSGVRRYVGYYGAYAESHGALDADQATQHDVKAAAQSLVNAVRMVRNGQMRQPDTGLTEAQPK